MSGEETRKKTSAEKVVPKMRVLREESGKKVFIAKDYLSVDQVTSQASCSEEKEAIDRTHKANNKK